MNTRELMSMTVEVPSVQALGVGPHGSRTIATVTGGHFEGERLRGRVVGGGDWLALRSDGVLELDLRLTLETDDGALIELSSFGLRHGPPEVIAALARREEVDPKAYYFRTTPRFSTASPKYAFLNRLLAVAEGDRRPSGPTYSIYEIL